MSQPPPLTVRHCDWELPLVRPAMSNVVDPHGRVRLTNRYVELDGRPSIPISGELHYSRVPREQWEHRLRVMKASGITIVSSYLIWIHHEEERGQLRFDGNRDVAAFVDLAERIGLDVIIRIGPWSHAEVRNGGLPDWVQHFGGQIRSNDPGYLELARGWYEAIGAELANRCGPHSPIVGIQIENELYNRPEHLVTLKQMARDSGLTAPIWTATGWGHAQLPDGEVLPVFGGYGDGHWVDISTVWDDTFRQHFFFSHTWDDPGIGGDLRFGANLEGAETVGRTASPLFPAATCELGGGTMNAYHRRTAMAGIDVAAVPHEKLGSGSAWQGYYMYAGGRNPAGLRTTLQESHATNYASDLPTFDYDFAAPIPNSGESSDSLGHLRRQHALIAAFGATLAPMPSSLPEVQPPSLDDVQTLRWALRSDGASGWVFINWQQPYRGLPPCTGVQFEVELAHETVTFPSQPITVPPGTLAHWPINLAIGGLRVRWATASALTLLGGDMPTLVLVADRGIPVEIAVDAGVTIGGQQDRDAVTVAAGDRIELSSPSGRARIVVLSADQGDRAWVVDGATSRRLVLADGTLWVGGDGRLATESEQLDWLDSAGELVPLALEPVGREPRRAEVAVTLTQRAGDPPIGYGERAGRASAPDHDTIERLAARYSIDLPEWVFEQPDEVFLDLEWEGDVATLGHATGPITDRFWDGRLWTERVSQLGVVAGQTLHLRVLPLHRDAAVRLPADAQLRRDSHEGPLGTLIRATVRQRPIRRTREQL